MAGAPEWFSAWSSQQDEKIGQITQAVNEIAGLKASVSKLDTGLTDLTARVAALENRSSGDVDSTAASSTIDKSASCWQPEFLEIKGFCVWGMKQSHGCSRAEAARIVGELSAALPADLQACVSGHKTWGDRSYSVRILLSDRNKWQDILSYFRGAIRSVKFADGDGSESLRIVPQSDPQTTARNRSMSRVFNWAVDVGLPKGVTVKAFWSPDFTLAVRDSETPDAIESLQQLCWVDYAGNVQWAEGGLSLLGMRNAASASFAVMAWKRPRAD